MSKPPHTVLFDGECMFCTFQSRLISWLDWFNAVRLVPIADPRVAEIAPGISRENLHEAMHCVTRDGRIYRGARCIRFISLRMPLAFPLALLLYIPGVIYLAEILYRFISRRRYAISRLFGCKGACAVLPARRREHDLAE
jgi:predicted DCC family thiol-disulfide oxidoreductase YuxK